MIRETKVSSVTDEVGNIITAAYKETSVILHCYILERNPNKRAWMFKEDMDLFFAEYQRHKVRSHIIAHDDRPYPNVIRLKQMLNNPTRNHSNVKTSSDYGSKLGGFCPTCLVNVKSECKKKFGGDW